MLGEGTGRSVLDGEMTSSEKKKDDEGNVRDSQTEVRNVEISSSVAGLRRRKSAFEKDG